MIDLKKKMEIQKKRLLKASVLYLSKPKPKPKDKYSYTDILIYRLKLGEAWTQREVRKSWLKIGLGGVLAGVGAVTIWLPSGSVFMIGAGCSLMISGGLDLWGLYRKAKGKAVFMKWKIKFKIRAKVRSIKERSAVAIMSRLPPLIFIIARR